MCALGGSLVDEDDDDDDDDEMMSMAEQGPLTGSGSFISSEKR